MSILESKTPPKSPGCYLFKDEKGQIIYVGKSKFLPKRVSSYFQKKHDDLKTTLLVEAIRDVDFVITESEEEALVVEENLIKLYQPKFNIKGKDDKTIRLNLTLTDEDYPRVELERGEVSGRPIAQFTSGMQAREVWELIHEVFPLRTCSYNLTKENIENGKFKPCLEKELGNCFAPCIGGVGKATYQKFVSGVESILSFNPTPIRKTLTRSRNWHSKCLEFEKSGHYQSRLESLTKLEKKIEPFRLVKTKDNLGEIAKFLGLGSVPLIIESFDNSHLNGDEGVSCSIRFVMGKPEKSSYRKYIIRKAKVGDDYGSFDEILERRFSRLLRESIQLPNLVIMDGGKGQVGVAKSVLERLGVKGVDIIGISKDQSHKPKLVHLSNGKVVDFCDVPHYEILGKVSEEIHRFTIQFHQSRRDKI